MKDISLAGLTILLAEDSNHDLLFFQEAYSQANLSNPLQVVRDGVEARVYLSGQGKYSDRTKYPFPILLLLDWKMPRMDGMETLTWIRKEEGPQEHAENPSKENPSRQRRDGNYLARKSRTK